MGQKVNPIGLRLGINRTWDSYWYSKDDYVTYVHEDIAIRSAIKTMLKNAMVGKVLIERTGKKIRITIYTARPGVAIGRKGADIERIKKKVSNLTSDEVTINIVEIKKPELDALLVAESVAQQLEKRVSFRRAINKAIQGTMKMGALGIRINCSGRLGGAEIARTEWYREGRVPLHTLRADISYGVANANTTYGVIGVKVWIYRGETGTMKAKVTDIKGSEV